MNPKLDPAHGSEESKKRRNVLIGKYLARIQAALDQSMDLERVAIYAESLQDLSERQIHYAFLRAMNECTYIPKIAELRRWAQEGAEKFQYEDVQVKTKVITGRSDKPDSWGFKIEDAYDELDAKAHDLWERDRVFILVEGDHKWPKLGRMGEHDIKGKFLCRCPKHQDKTPQIAWICYDRIMEAKRNETFKPSLRTTGVLNSEEKAKRGGPMKSLAEIAGIER